MSEWVFFKDSNTLGKYINKNNDTFIVVPSNIDGKIVTEIGGDNVLKLLEDGSSVSNGGIQGINGAKVIYMEDGIKVINSQAFHGSICKIYKSLENVIMPNSVIEIKRMAFYYCKYLKSIKLSENLTSIKNRVFDSCDNLMDITIPNSVTEIGMGAFSDCSNISEIIIPQSVTEIKLQAFANCEKLERIIFQNPECKIYDCEDTICNGYTYKNDPDNTVDSSCHEFIIDNNRIPYFTGIICGYENSTAQEYAEKYNRTFVAITETE